MGFLSSGFEKGETTYESGSGVMSLHQSSFTIFQSNPALILWELDLAILTVGSYSKKSLCCILNVSNLSCPKPNQPILVKNCAKGVVVCADNYP